MHVVTLLRDLLRAPFGWLVRLDDRADSVWEPFLCEDETIAEVLPVS